MAGGRHKRKCQTLQESELTQTFAAERAEGVDGTDKAYVSTESQGNCSLMHTCKGLIKRTAAAH